MAHRVMLVDDDPMVLEALQRVLHTRRPGFTVVSARSGSEALAALAITEADVVVLDYRMAGMNGIELAKAIRDRHPACCRIMLTGFADLEAAMTALNEAAIFRFFQKPCPSERLIEGIDAGLAERERLYAGAPALDQLPFASLLLGADGRVLDRNPAASALLEVPDGPSIDPAGRLRGATAADTAALLQAAERARTGRTSVIVALRRGGRHPLIASVRALNGASGTVLVHLADPEAPPCPSADTVGKLYGLTPAEARLAAALAGGSTVEEAAGALGVTPGSARTYLKTVFSKLGVSRQAELVRLVLGAATAAPSVQSAS
jgi:DNA-binding NarL/FixJ family response regulator